MFGTMQDEFYVVAIVFGFFWVVIEGLIAFWVYKIYKITKTRLNQSSRFRRRRASL